MASLEKRLLMARSHIITRQVFFASTLLRRPFEITTKIETACVSPKGDIKVNPKFCEPLNVKQLVFLLCHECLHYMMSHALRVGKRDRARWNWAGDAWNNETLIAEGIGEFIDGGIRYPGAQHMTVEELYDLAPEQPEGGGGGSLGADLSTEGVEAMSDAEISEAIATAEVEMAQAVNAAKQMGNAPTSIVAMVEQILHPPTPWHKYLEQFMTRQMERDYAFHCPDDTFRHLGLKVPGMDGVGCGEVVIVNDESGSVSVRELEHFNGHINRVLELCEPEKVYVLHVDTEVDSHVDEYEPSDLPITIQTRRRGGTDMGAGVAYAALHYPTADAIIVLTDGRTPWGEDPGLPVFWAITNEGIEADYGQSVHIDAND